MEIWKDILGYEGLYQVSSLGRVKSLKSSKERILKPCKDSKGYLTIWLCKDSKVKAERVSRLMAKAFIPNPENKSDVDHINKVRDDNRIENLQWLTRSENIKKSFSQGRVTSEKQRSAVTKMNKEYKQIVSIWINEKLNLEFIGSASDLIRAFPDQNLHHQLLSRVRTGKNKHHKDWKIKNN